MIRGSCHCGKVKFEIDGDVPEKLTRCTCSICSKRGYLIAYYPPERFRLTTPESYNATYRWRSELVANNFCPDCGCSTYFDSPAWQPDGGWDEVSRRVGVNARLFDDFDAAGHAVEVLDGKHLW